MINEDLKLSLAFLQHEAESNEGEEPPETKFTPSPRTDSGIYSKAATSVEVSASQGDPTAAHEPHLDTMAEITDISDVDNDEDKFPEVCFVF